MKSNVLIRLIAAGLFLTGDAGAATAASSGGAFMTLPTPAQVQAARDRLLAQCTPLPTPDNATRLPLHVTVWGSQGPRVVLVHGGVQGGLGGGPSRFAGQRALADEGWQLELIDRPGFGESPSRGPDNMEADAVLIARQLGEGAHLVGHSFGGAEALLAAAKRPEAVRSLILVEPALHPMLQTDPESQKNPVLRDGVQMVAKLTLAAKTPQEFAESFAQTLGADNPSGAALEAQPEKSAALGCALLTAKFASPAEMRDAADKVAKSGIPVLIISGGYSEPHRESWRLVGLS